MHLYGRPSDARVDQYALACVVHHSLTGTPPFERDSDIQVMQAHLTDAAPRVSEVRPDLPDAVDEVLSRAMAKEPGERYPAASDFAAALATALGVTGAGAGGESADKASGHCGDKAALSAGAGQCNGRGMARFSGAAQHPECDACADMAECEAELSAAGAQTQVVPLRNGVMFVYTANSPGAVNAVQAAVARRGARLLQFQTAGDKARLCADCKSMRGAAASGRLTREVVNIEGGALTLMTSDDPKVVAKIRAMMDRTAARAKI